MPFDENPNKDHRPEGPGHESLAEYVDAQYAAVAASAEINDRCLPCVTRVLAARCIGEILYQENVLKNEDGGKEVMEKLTKLMLDLAVQYAIAFIEAEQKEDDE